VIEGFLVELSTESQIRRNMEVNYFGAIATIKALLPMIKKARGRIVNISSAAGRFSTFAFGPYAASKFALEAISDALRAELALFGVSVILVEPGFTKTQFVTALTGKWEADWNNTNAELQEEYGEKFMGSYMGLFKILSNLLTTEPSSVVNTIAQAATVVHPQTRYQVGLETKFLIFVNNYVPTFLRDLVIQYLLKLFGLKPKAMIK